MKADDIEIDNQSGRKLPCILAAFITWLPPALLLILTIETSEAGSATWAFNPIGGDWGTAANWVPLTVPNGPNDTATFATSSITSVSLSANTEVNGIVFNPGADAFTITVPAGDASLTQLTISGVGITNNSGVTQKFVASAGAFVHGGAIEFTNSATVGNNVRITAEGGSPSGIGFTTATVSFQDSSSAGNAILIVNGGNQTLNGGGRIEFFNTSTAANATLTANGGSGNGLGGGIEFHDTSSAGNATVIANVGSQSAGGGGISFADSSNAGNATLIANGGSVASSVVNSGTIEFFNGSPSAGNATLIANGGSNGGWGGHIDFLSTSTAGNATLIANGGSNGGLGGTILFFDDSTGGTARVEVFGNGNLDIGSDIHFPPGVTIGSIEGSGDVFLGGNNLTVGSNNLSTTFSGVIQEGPSGGTGGSLTKIGTGTLTLSGANTYTGMTTINAGVLSISSDANLGTAPGAPVANQLTFNGGTLQATATFDLDTNRGITLLDGGGTIEVTGANTLSYAGSISRMGNLGNLTKVGTGTLILGGRNSYMGTTFVNEGTLTLVDNGSNQNQVIIGPLIIGDDVGAPNTAILIDSPPGPGKIFNSVPVTVNSDGKFEVDAISPAGGEQIGALVINRGNVSVTTALRFDSLQMIGGSISGAGRISVNLTPDLLTATSDASGNAATISTNVNLSTASNVLTVNDGPGSTDLLISGVIFRGSIMVAGITKEGTGTLVLSGANTYNGGTTINTGTLQLGNGGTSGSIVGDVVNNATFAVNRSDTFTFGGVISGAGAFGQLGTGTTVLIGANTYTGPTMVNAGRLLIDGSIGAGPTSVNAGGLLGGGPAIAEPGRGIIGGNLTNGGIVSPGNSPGTLTVNGNYTQTASGTLQIEIAGTKPGQFDLLRVGGHASLAGTLQLIPLNNFQLQAGDKLTFLTAQGGVSGTFNTIQNPFLSNTLIKAEINILGNAVQLEGTQGSFTSVACNPNTVAVGGALNSAVGDPRASGLINFLDTQPLNAICPEMELISPEELPAVFNVSVSLANIQSVNLARRMEDIRAGSRGFSAVGFAINTRGRDFNMGLAGPTGPEGKSGPSVMQPIPENRWGVWVTGLGEFTDVDSTSNVPGFDLTTGGMTFGADYRVCPNFAIGLTGGYAHTNADLVNNGSLDVNGGTIGAYATAFGGGFYVNAAATGTFDGYNSHRTALLGTASGDTNGNDFNGLVAAGYEWEKGGLTIGPTASYQYTYVDVDGFTESGSLAPLTLSDQNANSSRTTLGAKASYDWHAGHVLIRPEIRASWQHEFGDTEYSIVSRFANGAGNSFTVNGPAIGRDSLLIGAGAAVLLNDRVSVYAYYDGELARTNYSSNNVSAGMRITF